MAYALILELFNEHNPPTTPDIISDSEWSELPPQVQAHYAPYIDMARSLDEVKAFFLRHANRLN